MTLRLVLLLVVAVAPGLRAQGPASARSTVEPGPVLDTPARAAVPAVDRFAALMREAAGLDARDESRRAATVFEQALDEATRLGLEPERGAALNGLAQVLYKQTELARAQALAEESLALHARLGDLGREAEAANLAGNIHWDRGEIEPARAAAERALDLWTRAGDRLGVARVTNNLARILRATGRYDEAEARFLEALRILEDLGDRTRAATVIDNLSIVRSSRGDLPGALAFAERALAEREAMGHRSGIGKSLDTLAGVLDAMGESRRALAAYRRALAIRTALGERYGAAETVNNIGLLHLGLGDPARALAQFRRALGLATRAGAHMLACESYRNVGTAAARLGQFDRAEANLRASLRISDAQGYETYGASVRSDLGELALRRGRRAEGMAMLETAFAIRERHADHGGVVQSLVALGRARLDAGDAADAVRFAERAAAVADRYEQRTLAWQARTLAGRAQRRLGRTAAAREALDAAADGIEALRTLAPRDADSRQIFLSGRLSPYRELIALHAATGAPAAALQAAERAKARTLADRLAQVRPRPEGRADARLSLQDLDRLVDGPHAALLEYAASADGVHLFVVTRGAGGSTAIDAFRLPIGEAELERQVTAFAAAIAGRDLTALAAAARLGQVLLGPARALLAERTALTIVPDGALWRLPFAALRQPDGRYVIETAEVTYAPSLTVLRDLRAAPPPPANGRVLAMGLADHDGLEALPEAERQAAALRVIYGDERVDVRVGRDATVARFAAEAGSASVVHVATHGVFDPRRPMESHLVLAAPATAAGDRRLDARRLASLRLDARLVLLAACDTGRGRAAPGEGSVGLTWGVLASGARAAIVSQWQVEAGSASALLLGVHRGLAAGAPAPAALREAALALLRTPRHAHPFYWAGFALVGAPS